MTKNDKIKKFVMDELTKRKVTEPIDENTSLVLSEKLDSLFIVDLILFLETEFSELSMKVEDIKKEQIDTLNKMYALVIK
ncbi:MAG: hypothetical protein BroJett040_03510 [Oligoflexia bacterium]|nr:MAG: hypothetical protein BroJett040_03510 [Oligoflexia bacterium]